MKIKLSIVLLLFAIQSNAQVASDKYISSIVKVLSDCTMQYNMKCTYPDGSTYLINGKLGVKGQGYYYDSSNYRFLLYNKVWRVAADHKQKLVSVTHIPSVNKEFEDVGSLNMMSYLIDDKELLAKLKTRVLKEDNDFVWVELLFPDKQTISRFEVKMRKGNKVPVSYDIDFKLPMDYNVGASSPEDISYAELKVSSHNIIPVAPTQLFDERRLIKKVNNHQVSLRKFTSYQHL